jgi:amino-acid N-acetyltransferase
MKLSRSWFGGTQVLDPVGAGGTTLAQPPAVAAQASTSLVLRRAVPTDVPALQELLDRYARLGLVLPRAPESLYRHLREYQVAVEEMKVVACAGLRIYHQGLAEVVGVAVAESRQGRGIGRRIVRAVLEEARQLAIPRVFALTLQEPFFRQLGFSSISLEEIPEKLAADRAEGIDRSLCRKSTMIRALDPPLRAGVLAGQIDAEEEENRCRLP